MPLVIFKSDARARQKPCLRCGYSLRNNIDARNCPECGLAVRISLNPDDSLEMSNPEWLTAMSRAAGLLVIAHLGFAAALGWIQWGYFYHRPLRTFFPLDSIRQTEWIVGVALVVAALAAVVLARPERRYPDRLRGRRVLARVGAALTAAVVAFELLRPPHAMRFFIPTLVQAAVVAFTSLVVWSTLHELARRLPSRPLMQTIAILAWIPTFGLGLMQIVGPGAWALYMMAWQPWSQWTWPWTLASLIYVPVATITLLRCCRDFRAAARQGDQNWVTDP
jgi:hypothetical protein